MGTTNLSLPQPPGLAETSRVDSWWAQPLFTFLGLLAFVIYLTWAAFQGVHYWHDGNPAAAWQPQYLSPAYSPVLYRMTADADGTPLPGVAPADHALLGEWPGWLPRQVLFVTLTPAFLILWGPGLFRFTCYYYRGAYYKAFWADPLNCGVGEPSFRGGKYLGERFLPLVLHNIHRYALYIAILFIFILTYDAIISYIWIRRDGQGVVTGHTFGIGIGSLIITMNVILLSGYTFGCHSLRHLVGGGLNRLAGRPLRKKTYDCVSCLNRGHMKWAWASLIWVGFTDIYIRIASMNEWNDALFVIGGTQ